MPNCFLLPYKNEGVSVVYDDKGIWESDAPSRSDMVKTLEICDEMIEKFKDLWYHEYLLSLRESLKDIHQMEFNNKIKCDDVVLVKDPTKSHPFWCLGRVVELFPGDDNNVRSARIRKGDGTCSVNSIKHLYPLELSITHSHHPLHSVDDVDFEGFDLDSIEESKLLNIEKQNVIEKSLAKVDENDEVPHQETQKMDTSKGPIRRSSRIQKSNKH